MNLDSGWSFLLRSHQHAPLYQTTAAAKRRVLALRIPELSPASDFDRDANRERRHSLTFCSTTDYAAPSAPPSSKLPMAKARRWISAPLPRIFIPRALPMRGRPSLAWRITIWWRQAATRAFPLWPTVQTRIPVRPQPLAIRRRTPVDRAGNPQLFMGQEFWKTNNGVATPPRWPTSLGGAASVAKRTRP